MKNARILSAKNSKGNKAVIRSKRRVIYSNEYKTIS